MPQQFENRLRDPESINTTLQAGLDRCGLGRVVSHTLVDVGFEDYNVIVKTEDDHRYFVKVLSKTRSMDEAQRYASIIDAVSGGAINHPKVYRDSEGNILLQLPDGTSMFVMDAIQGRTFFDMGSAPTEEQLRRIVEQAVKIAQLPIAPPYEYDSWAVPNIRDIYDKVQNEIDTPDKSLIDKALQRYEALSIDELPTCFVHGDMTKANIITGDDGKLYVIDFSVANIYPRIQELVVMATSLMFDESHELPLQDRIETLARLYIEHGGELTVVEHDSMYDYALAALAMEYLGSLREGLVHGDSEEIRHWQHVGISGLRKALQ
ncbi:MAG: phosphotransferase [Candidatus Saccharimonadales bacterium]